MGGAADPALDNLMMEALSMLGSSSEVRSTFATFFGVGVRSPSNKQKKNYKTIFFFIKLENFQCFSFFFKITGETTYINFYVRVILGWCLHIMV